MDLLNVALSALFSVIVLFILTKLMGRRQVSQLSMFDYINGITIGSIAAEMATSLEGDVLKPLIAMVVYALAAIIISYASCKSYRIRRFIIGKPLIFYDNGKIYEENLKMAKFDLGEFMTECRNAGYFDLKEIETAVYEPNGKVSFLPVSEYRPVMPNDLGMTLEKEKAPTALIVDGIIIDANLKQSGNDDTWLKNQLKECNLSLKEVFFAICDDSNKFTAYKKTNIKKNKEIFE